MDEKAKNSLVGMLDSFDRRQEESSRVRGESKREEDVFLEQFKQKRASVVRPLFEEVGKELRARGHEFDVTEQEDHVDLKGPSKDARIVLTLYPRGSDKHKNSREDFPSFTVAATRYSKKIWFHGSNMMPGGGGAAGPRGDCTIDKLTPELVQEKLFGLLGEVFGRGDKGRS